MPVGEDFDHDLYNAIEELVFDGELEKGTAAYGIAMKVCDEGKGSLSSMQLYIYQRDVEAVFKRREPPLPDHDEI
jgi:hypothetical protein